MKRREFIAASAALLAAGCSPGGPVQLPEDAPPLPIPPMPPGGARLIGEIERRAFQFFRETTNPANGLAPDRWPTPSFCSIAAVGFALSAWIIGAERRWITRSEARSRVLTTLAFLHDAPQGPQASGTIGYKGFFYHFIDMETGMRFRQVELSTIDTALLMCGVLHCAVWFDGADPEEARIRELAEALYARVDWRWAQPRLPAIGHGWTPEAGPLKHDYIGYNEALLLYLLALGSPTHPVDASAWDAWTSKYDRGWSKVYGYTYLRYPVLFVHQFPQCWFDLRGLSDTFMRARGIDYFENTRRATYAQRAYAAHNPEGWADYGPEVWGVTACDGPARVTRHFGDRVRRFQGYSGRGIGRNDDGTIAPYAAACSLPHAPEIVIPALATMHQRYGETIWGRYGFFAFNRSFDFPARLHFGRRVPGFGWVDIDYLGIEVGPTLMMLANYRDASVWKAMHRSPHLVRGLLRAGFTGGWLDQLG
jgi:hypothetical protein